MATITFPTGKDISIEVNGQKLAVAQSYKAKTTKTSRTVEAFGSREPWAPSTDGCSISWS